MIDKFPSQCDAETKRTSESVAVARIRPDLIGNRRLVVRSEISTLKRVAVDKIKENANLIK